jgi:hypothetical protein
MLKRIQERYPEIQLTKIVFFVQHINPDNSLILLTTFGMFHYLHNEHQVGCIGTCIGFDEF